MNYGNMNNGLADRLHDILDTKLETNYGVVICGVNSEQLHALLAIRDEMGKPLPAIVDEFILDGIRRHFEKEEEKKLPWYKRVSFLNH